MGMYEGRCKNIGSDPGKSSCNQISVISKRISRRGILNNSCEIAVIYMPQDLINDKPTLVQLMLCAIRKQAITWTDTDKIYFAI